MRKNNEFVARRFSLIRKYEPEIPIESSVFFCFFPNIRPCLHLDHLFNLASFTFYLDVTRLVKTYGDGSHSLADRKLMGGVDVKKKGRLS